MRRIILATVVTAAMLVPAAPALALGDPQRPSGSFTPFPGSVNSGDNGFGNCGHNSSGGARPVDGGNGGLVDVAKHDQCVPQPTGTDGDGSVPDYT